MNIFRKGMDALVGLLGAAALALACFAVASRYLAPDLTVDWSDEVVIMLLIWAMFLGGFGITLDRSHIAVDLLSRGRENRWIARLPVFNAALLAIYALGLTISGVLVVIDSMRLGERTESTARLPTFIYYASLPVGMALVCLAALSLFVGRRSLPRYAPGEESAQ